MVFDFKNLVLKSGSHSNREAGVCAMEAVAWMNSEPHSDKPKCACPVLTRAFQSLNDSCDWLDDQERTKYLKPLLKKLIGTNDTQSKMREKLLAYHALSWSAPFALIKAAEVLQRKGYKKEAASLFREAEILQKEPTKENALKAKSAANAAAAYAAANAAAAYAAADAANAAADAADADANAAYADAAYAAYADAADAADASRKNARRVVLFERVRILTECLEKFPAKGVST